MTATVHDTKTGDRYFLTPRVPQGLAAAVEGLTREVIRHRPENIYVFAAHHFEKLLHLREQYDGNTVNTKSMEILHDINDAIKERHAYLESKQVKENNFVQHSGWSLNETAKVLEKHRSIFGERNQKITTEEVRELANEPVLTTKLPDSSPKKKSEKPSGENKNITGKHPTVKKKESPRVAPQDVCAGTSKQDTRNAPPKIISQIPLAKDIKMELKKNRMSSRERKKVEEKKMQVACEYTRETTTEKTSRRSVERTKRSYDTRSEQRKYTRTEESTKKKIDTTKEKIDSPKIKRTSRSLSMDRVKNYVVQNFVGMTSLDELQSPSYVEKVQEVIDETSTIIKEKVEALKTGIVKAKTSKQSSKKEHSGSSEEHSKASNKSGASGKKSQEGSLQESSSSRSLSKNGQSTKTIPDNVDVVKSADNSGSAVDQSETKLSDHSDASNDSKISLPAVRPPSSKSTSRSLSARSDYDGLVLPPISPESVKSPKVKEEFVLPVLSPPRSNVVTPDFSADSINSNGKNSLKGEANNEEEFQDSLNVTPDLIDEPPLLDSLENSGHNSPVETLKDKLLEIEKVQRRIEGVLDDTVGTEQNTEEKANDEANGTSKIQDKLLEIQETEKRIEKILDSQPTAVNESETLNLDIKNKLQELEDAEKRIENIFVNEASKESANQTGTVPAKSTEQINDNLTHEVDESAAVSEPDKNLSSKTDTNSVQTSSSNNPSQNALMPREESRALSPHSYILTEGSPYEIPDSVTTVIIPDRVTTPDSDTLEIELEDGKVTSTFISSKEIKKVEVEDHPDTTQEEKKTSVLDAFGEPVDTNNIETSTVDADYIRGIKVNHDMIVTRQDLDLIQEERDKEDVIDSEDEKVLKVVTSSLEEILDKDEVEYVSKEEVETAKIADKEEFGDLSPEAVQGTEYESTDETKETSITDGIAEHTEVVENSLDIEETTGRSAESTNEIKETSLTTDRSSLSFDPAIPIVPELNLDSLPDLTISSFVITDDDQKEEKNKKGSKDSSSYEIPISSGSTKGNLSTDRDQLEEEKSSAEAEVKYQEVQSSRVEKSETEKETENVIESEKEDASPKDKTEIVDELKEEYVQEQLETEEYEKLEKSLKSSRSEQSIAEETTVVTQECEIIETTHEEHESNVTEYAALHSDDAQVVEDIKENVESVPVGINNIVCDAAAEENKQTTSESSSLSTMAATAAASSSRLNLLAHRTNDEAAAESSSSSFSDQLEKVGETVAATHLGVVDQQENCQLVDSSSRASSQCTTTRRLDSDEISIKSNAEESIALVNNLDGIARENSWEDESKTAVVTEQIEDGTDEKKHYHIYVPEISGDSKEGVSSSSESSTTFMSAATKIQAGVRGFLTRRRLQSTQRRSSTLDSVPSIQESSAAESSPPASTTATPPTASTKTIPASSSSHLMPIVETTPSLPDTNPRKKLRREDAVQRTTLSVENAFAENQLQHTGEFHDCIPLPVFEVGSQALKAHREQREREKKAEQEQQETPSESPKGPNVEQLLGKILLGHAAASAAAFPVPPSKFGQLVDVVLLPGDTEAMLQNSYLNFITSVEDVASELFDDPLVRLPNAANKGVIIEEITSLDESKTSDKTAASKTAEENPPAQTDVSDIEESCKESLIEASTSTSDEPLSMNIEEVLGLGEEGEEEAGRSHRLLTKLPGLELPRSASLSQESRLSDERTRSPVTMMQIAPDDKSERSEAGVAATSTKEDKNAEEKEQESPSEKKSNDGASAN